MTQDPQVLLELAAASKQAADLLTGTLEKIVEAQAVQGQYELLARPLINIVNTLNLLQIAASVNIKANGAQS